MENNYITDEWIDYYRKLRKEIKERERQHFDKLYQIQLFDRNRPSCSSGVTQVFVDDIEKFAAQYTILENNKERVERFRRSKAGEIVTDYYSDNPSLNIVQKVSFEELGWTLKWKTNQSIIVPNGYNWPVEYYFGVLCFEIRWIRFKDQILKLTKPKGLHCCRKGLFYTEYPCRRIFIDGNPFWIYQENTDTPYAAKDIASYMETSLESYVWHVADRFNTEEEFAKDQRRAWPLKMQIARAFADLPGEAG